MIQFAAAKAHILHFLESKLPEGLFYHGIHHTLDVYAAAKRLAEAEAINPSARNLLLTAALFHDAGFVQTYQNHEQAGCDLAWQMLPPFGYRPDQIEHICDMIMATRIPQTPQDHLGQILCDADLDYLGRQDFFQIGQTLFHEFKERGIVTGEEDWNRLQVSFLSTHRYFTQTAREMRQAVKTAHLSAVEEIVAGYV